MKPQPARVLLVDWPWKFGDNLPGKKRGAAKNYGCMPAERAATFELPLLADNCLMLFWRVASMQQEALDIVGAWGFVVKSEIVWAKLTKNGAPWFGMGRYVRNGHEVCLICTRGRVKVNNRSIRSGFAAPVPVDERGRYIHSAKPPEIYAIAEKLSDGPYVELFARRRREGWIQFGKQLPRPNTEEIIP
jgi:N6-adenosine-specific RNA methylase IME4